MMNIVDMIKYSFSIYRDPSSLYQTTRFYAHTLRDCNWRTMRSKG